MGCAASAAREKLCNAPGEVHVSAKSRAPEGAREESEILMSGNDCRCHCGSLLGRLAEHGVEIKCRRCKLIFIVPFEEGKQGGSGTT